MPHSGRIRLKMWALVSVLALRPQSAETATTASLKLVGYLRPVASLRVARRSPRLTSHLEIVTRGDPYKLTVGRWLDPALNKQEALRVWFNGHWIRLHTRALPVFASPVVNGVAVHHQFRVPAGSPPVQLTFIQN